MVLIRWGWGGPWYRKWLKIVILNPHCSFKEMNISVELLIIIIIIKLAVMITPSSYVVLVTSRSQSASVTNV